MSSLKDTDLHIVACEVTKPCGSQELVYAGWLAMGAVKKLAELPRRELVYLSDAEEEIDRLRAEVAELAQQRGDLAMQIMNLTNQRAELRMLIANDGYAISFQTFGQYRTALLRAIAAQASRPVNVASDSQPSERTE